MEQYFCTKCGIKTDQESDLHCRKLFIQEITKLLESNDLEGAKNLFNQVGFDERWKEFVLKNKLGENFKRLISNERFISKFPKVPIIFNGDKTKDLRVTHCYACQVTLDSFIDKGCSSCNWLICHNCGACRCGK